LQNFKQTLGEGVNGHRKLLLGLKRPGHEVDRTLSSGIDVKNGCIYTLVSLHMFL